MQRRDVVYGFVAVALLAAGGYGWHAAGMPVPGLSASDPGQKAKEPPVPVHVWRAREEEVPVAFGYTGTVVSPKVAELRARVTGTVMERPLKPGSAVRAGDLLFRIDPRPFEAALAQAMAQREQSQASLDYGNAQVARFTPLARSGITSQERLQQVTRDRDTAQSQVRQADAQIMRERLNLDYATVLAPFTGRAGLTNVNIGDMAIADQTQLVSVAQLDPIDVQIALSASDLQAVRDAIAAGRQPKVQILGADGKPDGREARIHEFDNQFNPRTARLLVRASMGNADERVAPGDFVRVRLQTGTEKRIMVPTTALSSHLDQQIVYLVQDGKAHPQPVVATDEYGDKTAVEEGLKMGAEVVADNIQRLQGGTEVRIVESNDRTAER